MFNRKDISKDDLGKLIRDWAARKFGPSFSFRSTQLEMVRDTIYAWFNDMPDCVINAPTGSGKSIISLTIAGFLSEVYKMKGYVLISDLSLLQQYENDVMLYFPEWGVIRGQHNYTCVENKLSYPNGACKLKGCFTKSAMAHFPCYETCEYIAAREKASQAAVTVCTYSFWLVHLNKNHSTDVNNMSDVDFAPRDFVICDEAHKLVDIVQNHFSPTVNREKDQERVELLLQELNIPSASDLYKKYLEAREKLINEEMKPTLFEYLKEYSDVLTSIYAAVTTRIPNLIGSLDVSIARKIVKTHSWLEDNACKFAEYCNILKKKGVDVMIKNYSSNDIGNIKFNCIDDSYLVRSKFHSHCKYKLFMSATLGNLNVYAKSIGVEKFCGYEMMNTFDYSQSPIYFVQEYSMGFRYKDQNLPYIIKMISNIMNMYVGKRGIIQTGNYAIAKAIKDNIDPINKERLLVYTDSSNKDDMIDIHRIKDDTVLVGPSLIEGLSLDDDLCRFQIIAKVPYPSLTDKFVEEKMKLDEQWYTDRTAMSILQGVGRGVRNNNDWCVTFILDRCFNQVVYRSNSMFDSTFLSRVQIIPASTLLY